MLHEQILLSFQFCTQPFALKVPISSKIYYHSNLRKWRKIWSWLFPQRQCPVSKTCRIWRNEIVTSGRTSFVKIAPSCRRIMF